MDEYRIQMGPVGSVRQVGAGRFFRAVLPNGWGPACWHDSVDAAVGCLKRKISQVLSRGGS